MPDAPKPSIGYLYALVLREVENDAVQELPPDLYPVISEYVGGLKRVGYDGMEAKINDELVGMTAGLVRLLVGLRLEKAVRDTADLSNLADVERYVIDSARAMQERQEMILTAVLSGKTKLLESVSERHKIRLTAVRFTKAMDQFMGVDTKEYGPFEPEDIANIPHENALPLISTRTAAKVWWED